MSELFAAPKGLKAELQRLATDAFIEKHCHWGYKIHDGGQEDFHWFIGKVEGSLSEDPIWFLRWDDYVANSWTEFLPSEHLALARLVHLQDAVSRCEAMMDMDTWMAAQAAPRASQADDVTICGVGGWDWDDTDTSPPPLAMDYFDPQHSADGGSL